MAHSLALTIYILYYFILYVTLLSPLEKPTPEKPLKSRPDLGLNPSPDNAKCPLARRNLDPLEKLPEAEQGRGGGFLQAKEPQKNQKNENPLAHQPNNGLDGAVGPGGVPGQQAADSPCHSQQRQKEEAGDGVGGGDGVGDGGLLGGVLLDRGPSGLELGLLWKVGKGGGALEG